MKKFLIAGSSLAAVAAAGSAGAVDVTLGGSIDMGIAYGVGKGLDEELRGEDREHDALGLFPDGVLRVIRLQPDDLRRPPCFFFRASW